MDARSRRIPLAIVAVALSCGSAGLRAEGPDEREIEKRAQGRADLWTYYQENDPDGSHRWRWQLRVQYPFSLPGGWKMAVRGDVPLRYTNEVGPANRDGGYEAGLGDIFGQVTFTTPELAPGFDLTFGARLVTPTGGPSPFGGSQWRIGPQIGFGYDIPISEGVVLELSPRVRYLIGFHPTRSGTTTGRSIDVYPTISLSLPDQWVVALWNDIQMSYDNRANAWFVPLDLMIIKKLGPRFQIGIGAAMRLVNDSPSYKYLIYGRSSVYF